MVERRSRNGGVIKSNGQKPLEGEVLSVKHPGGRPTDYNHKFAKAAEVMCKLGARDVDLADAFDVTIATIWHWKSQHAEFLSATSLGKQAADEWVERALYHKATGYTFDSEKIFFDKTLGIVRARTREHVPPSDNAISLWLRNRRPDRWQTDVEHDHKTQIILNITKKEYNF